MMRIGLLTGGIVLILDHLTKWLMRDVVLDGVRYIKITGFFNLVEVWNRGVSFGLFASSSLWTPVLLSALAIGISIVLLVWLRKAETLLLSIALGIVIGGAVGNVIDRILWGHVFDFLDFHIAGYHWPAFNVADSAIMIGVALILVDGFIAKMPDDG
ncbi:MAG: signal peptidase II [Pseudomonadota bacterium]|nr:signal peptidase II [Pseudomonadota bacterium]